LLSGLIVMPPPPPTFHIVGDALVDFFAYLEGDWPEPGGDSVLGRPLETFAGGSATNTATHLKALAEELVTRDYEDVEGDRQQRHQPKIVLQTVLNPNDQYGKILLAHSERWGLDLINCNTDNSGGASTGHCVAIVSRGERSFMTHRGCVEKFEARHLVSEKMIAEDADLHVHVAGYFNMENFWNGKLKGVISRIRRERRVNFAARKTTVSLVTQSDATNEWDGGIDEVIPLLDFFILNELEANKIVASGRRRRNNNSLASSEFLSDDECGVDDRITGHGEWIRFFSCLSPSTCFVVTRGSAGAIAFRNGSIVAELNPAVCVDVLDPTGAGDAFAAGLLYGVWFSSPSSPCETSLLSSHKRAGDASDCDHCWSAETILKGLLWGCAVGTASVTIRGASIPPKIRDVLDLYERGNAAPSQD